MIFGRPTTMVSPEQALPGHPEPIFTVPSTHVVLHTPLQGPWPEGSRVLYVAMGCFWGAERIFWRQPGVISTAVGYMGGYSPNPTYEETCTGRTGHTESVQVVFDPEQTDVEHLLKAFWENHDPTQTNRQGNDVGTQYRSAIYWTEEADEAVVHASREAFNAVVREHGFSDITTELRPASDAGPFYYAEDYHQQYLHKNPGGYCNHGPNGCQMPALSAEQLAGWAVPQVDAIKLD